MLISFRIHDNNTVGYTGSQLNAMGKRLLLEALAVNSPAVNSPAVNSPASVLGRPSAGPPTVKRPLTDDDIYRVCKYKRLGPIEFMKRAKELYEDPDDYIRAYLDKMDVVHVYH
jgi:hypothetical protein